MRAVNARAREIALVLLAGGAACGSAATSGADATEPAPDGAPAQPPGSLDPSFGGAGLLRPDLGVHTAGVDVAVDPRGRIIVLGRQGGEGLVGAYVLLRLMPDGELDASFADGGVFVGGDLDSAEKVVSADDGGYLVAGDCGVELCVVRHLEDGTRDTGYGAKGRAVVPTTRFVGDAVLDSAGRLVLAAAALDGPAGLAPAVMRLTPDGGLDMAFGTSGRVTIPVSGLGQGVVVRPDGRIVLLAGASDADGPIALAVGLTDDGSTDAGLPPGRVSLDGVVPWQLGLQPDGKLLVVGESWRDPSDPQVAAYRLDADGQPDEGFGAGGGAVVDVGGDPGSWDAALDVVESDGRVVLAGLRTEPGAAVLVRLLQGGDLDPSFMGGVVPFTPTPGRRAQWTGLAVQPDGRVVVAGFEHDDSDLNVLIVARYAG